MDPASESKPTELGADSGCPKGFGVLAKWPKGAFMPRVPQAYTGTPRTRRPQGHDDKTPKPEGKKKKPGDDLLSRNSSTIGAEELNFRVRDGNGWDLFAMITRRLITK